MSPFSMEMAAAHRKFEFERAVKAAQVQGRIRREIEAAKQQMGATGSVKSSDEPGIAHALVAFLRRLVPVHIHRTTAGTRP
jgi:hypothetical protein